MLAQLVIRDIVLIEKLDLRFSAGMTVLTGETGAGKSILLDALLLAIGGRGDGGLVRAGEKQGQVTAVFDIVDDHPAWDVAARAGIGRESALILRRVQSADGRTRAFVNDEPVGTQVLRDVGRSLVEVHGQHDDRALVDPAVHRALLDAFGNLEEAAATVRERHGALQRVSASLRDERLRVEKAAADRDYLRHARDELVQLAPETGEEQALAERRTAMQQAAKVSQDIRDAFESVAGEGSPATTLQAAMRRLDRRALQAPELIEPSVKAIDAVLVALDGARDTLEQALRASDFDPRELEAVEERLFALRASARKHQVEPDQLAALAEAYHQQLAAIDAGEAQVAALEAEVLRIEGEYAQAAERLSKGRHEAAARLNAAVERELGPLKLDRARFLTQVDTQADSGGAHGLDRVEFWVATNPGSRPGPMTKVASGGELARFMLALKVVLADRGSAPTLVFDEIDTGVGGAVADAIGQRLARLASQVQVLAVTHAPQVAARSTAHFRISKVARRGGDQVATSVNPLAPDARREEIARMLAGATVTDEARAAATRLLNVGG